MILTGIPECNQIIYSYLESHDLWSLRAISKAMKGEVEKSEIYKKDKRIAEDTWNLACRPNINSTDPAWLHSNGKKLRIMNYNTDQLWNIDPSATLPLQLITLEKVDTWKEVFWDDKKVAIAKPIFPKKYSSCLDYKPTSYVTTIFDTESGKNLAQHEDASLYPIDWYHHQLLMREKKNTSQVVSLFAWNVLNSEAGLPKKIFSFQSQNSFKIACQKGKVYCLKYKEKQPFAKLDLQNQCVNSLKYQMDRLENSPDNMKNFGVTSAGNIFFSQNRSFVLLNGETSEMITNIVLPIFPTNIIFQSPLMACYQSHQFLVYDIRKIGKPVYHHHYLTWSKQLYSILSLQSHIMSVLGGDPLSDIKIRAIAFHNRSLFVSKMDNSVDHFDLAASSNFSFRDLKFW